MIERPILQCVNLNDALNTTFTNQSDWEFNGTEYSRTGFFDNEQYRVFIQPIFIPELSPSTHNSTILNLGFTRVLSSEQDIKPLQDSCENRTKVAGAVTNAINKKVIALTNQFEIEFIIFNVVSEEDSRLPFYQMLVRSPMYGIRPWRQITTVPIDGSTVIVCTKNAGHPANTEQFMTWLKNNNRTLVT
jgi:hypothetical protein